MKKKTDEPEVVRAARELQDALDRIERLTEETSKTRVTSRGKLSRAAEMLDNAAGAHRDFLARLAALTEEVSQMRERQNQSAATLSSFAEQLDQRRQQCEALEQRFAELGQTANEVAEQLTRAGGSGEEAADPERLRAALPAIRHQLAEAVDAAAALTRDARDAELSDLERQAHAIRQQLEAMLAKLSAAAPSPAN